MSDDRTQTPADFDPQEAQLDAALADWRSATTAEAAAAPSMADRVVAQLAAEPESEPEAEPAIEPAIGPQLRSPRRWGGAKGIAWATAAAAVLLAVAIVRPWSGPQPPPDESTRVATSESPGSEAKPERAVDAGASVEPNDVAIASTQPPQPPQPPTQPRMRLSTRPAEEWLVSRAEPLVTLPATLAERRSEVISELSERVPQSWVDAWAEIRQAGQQGLPDPSPGDSQSQLPAALDGGVA